jgi:hypothetical protein
MEDIEKVNGPGNSAIIGQGVTTLASVTREIFHDSSHRWVENDDP